MMSDQHHSRLRNYSEPGSVASVTSVGSLGSNGGSGYGGGCGGVGGVGGVSDPYYQDLEFYPDNKKEVNESLLTVPGNHYYHGQQGLNVLNNPLKDFEAHPPPGPPGPGGEEISLEDIMALVDPGIGGCHGYTTVYQHRLVERPPSTNAVTSHHNEAVNTSKLHQALTQPSRSKDIHYLPPSPPLIHHPASLNSAPSLGSSNCNRCHKELTSRCLVQTCRPLSTTPPSPPKSSSPTILTPAINTVMKTAADTKRHPSQETKCRDCGHELTAKCILAMCSGSRQNNNSLSVAT